MSFLQTFVFSVESEMHGIDVKVTANYKELSDEVENLIMIKILNDFENLG